MNNEQLFWISIAILSIAMLVAGSLLVKISMVVSKIKAAEARQAKRKHADTRAQARLRHLHDRLGKLVTYQKSIKRFLFVLFVLLITATNLGATQ